MELKLAEQQNYKQLRKLYREAFPLPERAPFHMLTKRAEQGRADFWCLYEEEQWVGMAYVIRDKDLAYIFYLAIDKTQRGKGYGNQVLDLLKDQYSGCRMFLALEDLDETASNYEQRVRRHAFYEHGGLSDLPLKIKEATMVYAMMGTGGEVQPEEYNAMMNAYLGPVLRRLVDMRMIP